MQRKEENYERDDMKPFIISHWDSDMEDDNSDNYSILLMNDFMVVVHELFPSNFHTIASFQRTFFVFYYIHILL